MRSASDVFSRITHNGKRAWCPECDDGTARKQGTVQINGEYAYCHKCQFSWDFSEEKIQTPRIEYKLTNTKVKVESKEVKKSGYSEARATFVQHWKKGVRESLRVAR